MDNSFALKMVGHDAYKFATSRKMIGLNNMMHNAETRWTVWLLKNSKFTFTKIPEL